MRPARARRRPISYANVTATIALLMALTMSSAYARDLIGANQIKANAVKSRHIAAKAVKTSDLAGAAVGTPQVQDAAVTGTKVQDGSLSAADLAAGTVPVVLSARVLADGTLQENRGAVSASRVGTGDYRVTFDRSVLGCSPVAAPRAGHADLIAGIASVTTVVVRLVAPDGLETPQDGSFSLVVVC